MDLTDLTVADMETIVRLAHRISPDHFAVGLRCRPIQMGMLRCGWLAKRADELGRLAR
jgi:hypothetical protein